MEPANSQLADNKACLTIEQFCSTHQISRDTYNRLQREGRGPSVVRLSKRKVLIPVSSARDWLSVQTGP